MCIVVTTVKRYRQKLNRLQRLLPDGLLADARWLTEQGYPSPLRARYLTGGWLERVGRGVFRRPAPRAVHWQQAVASLQMLLGRGVSVGGRTALELQGYAHYPSPRGPMEIHLYGDERPPGWLHALDGARFVHHNADRLFDGPPLAAGIAKFRTALADDSADLDRPFGDGLLWRRLNYEWGVVMSTPERAALEMLDELPGRETFHDADMLMSGLVNLRAARLTRLLSACRSVKVKRLFLWFAERHGHQWVDRLDLSNVDLGSGKRALVRGGKLDAKYQITVPEDLDAA